MSLILSPGRRLLLVLSAFGATTAYAWSFALAGTTIRIVPVAGSIGIASGASWLVFGLVLLGATRCQPGILTWADTCLLTMAVGNTILGLSILLNGVVAWVAPRAVVNLAPIHLGILLMADIAMAVTFVRRGRELGLTRLRAAGLWILVLNGAFVALLALLQEKGGWHP